MSVLMPDKLDEGQLEAPLNPVASPVTETRPTSPPLPYSNYNPPSQPYYYSPAPPVYTPAPPARLNAGNIIFWVFYALVGVWIDLSLTVTLWTCALVLPFALPLVLAVGPRGLFPSDMIYRSSDWLYWQSDTTIYALAAATSLFGVLLLVLAILGIKPWLRFHVALFRDLGGLRL